MSSTPTEAERASAESGSRFSWGRLAGYGNGSSIVSVASLGNLFSVINIASLGNLLSLGNVAAIGNLLAGVGRSGTAGGVGNQHGGAWAAAVRLWWARRPRGPARRWPDGDAIQLRGTGEAGALLVVGSGGHTRPETTERGQRHHGHR